MKTILITGAAGFIGFHTALKLLKQECRVIGVDNLTSYYDISLKEARLEILKKYPNFKFYKETILNFNALENIFQEYPDIVIHLAGQPGVQFGNLYPFEAINNNVIAFTYILELCVKSKVKHLIYASSSSVYGNTTDFSSTVLADTNHPVSVYAATKKCDEVLAHAYSSSFGLKTTGLRFFSVYGPFGRPDMFIYKIVDKFIKGENITLYNKGNYIRDFTYITDVVDCIIKSFDLPELYNIENVGHESPIKIYDVVYKIHDILKKKHLLLEDYDLNSHITLEDKRTWDVIKTSCKGSKFHPATNIEKGLNNFINWYNEYHN